VLQDVIKAMYQPIQATIPPALIRRRSRRALAVSLLRAAQLERATETASVVVGRCAPQLEPGTVDIQSVEPQQPACEGVELCRAQRDHGLVRLQCRRCRPRGKYRDGFRRRQPELAKRDLMTAIGPRCCLRQLCP